MKPRIGWYYHFEWGCDATPEYWNGEGSSPILDGPFDSEWAAYEDQYAKHRFDSETSKDCARWCKDQMKKAKVKK